MTCNKFSFDIYALHALGLCEEPEKADLIWHLASGCESCEASLREALSFWFLFACLPDDGDQRSHLEPSPELKTRILAIVHPLSSRPPIHRWTTERIAAGTLIIFGLGVTSWQMGRSSGMPRLRDALSQANEERSRAERLAAENRGLQARGLPPSPASRAIPPAQPVDTARVDSLSRQLNDVSARAAVSDQALTTERARIGELERDIADKTSLLDAATRNRDDLDRRLSDAQRVLVQTTDRSAEQDNQIAGFQTQIRDLEGQIVQYRRVIEVQQQSLTQHVQLASLIQSPSLRFVPLHGTEAGPSARGVALIAGNSSMVFYVSSLPALPGNRVYQLWLMRSRGPAIASAGIFSSSRSDQPAVELRNPQLLAGVTALAVTDEPAGGSPLPTGHKLLVGTPQ